MKKIISIVLMLQFCIFISSAVAASPADESGSLKDMEVQSTDATNIGEKIELIATAGSAQQLREKTKPTAVVVQPDSDRTFFFWRDDKGAWSMAEVFQYDAAGKKVFAIGKQIPDKQCPLPPVFLMAQFPVRKIKHLESAARAEDGCGKMPGSNNIEWVAWSEFGGGSGCWIYQQIFFFAKNEQGRWVSRGQGICDASARCGGSLNICSNTKYSYSQKGGRLFADHSYSRFYAITPGEGPTRLQMISHSQRVITPEGNHFTIWPHLKVSDLEQYKDKYMDGAITLDSVAGLLAFCKEPFDEKQREKENIKTLGKLYVANPKGLQSGRIYLEKSKVKPLTKEELAAIQKKEEFVKSEGFKKEDDSKYSKYSRHYKKQNVKMADVRRIMKELGLKHLHLRPNGPILRSPDEPVEYVAFNKDPTAGIVVFSKGVDIQKDDTIVDVVVYIYVR